MNFAYEFINRISLWFITLIGLGLHEKT